MFDEMMDETRGRVRVGVVVDVGYRSGIDAVSEAVRLANVQHAFTWKVKNKFVGGQILSGGGNLALREQTESVDALDEGVAAPDSDSVSNTLWPGFVHAVPRGGLWGDLNDVDRYHDPLF